MARSRKKVRQSTPLGFGRSQGDRQADVMLELLLNAAVCRLISTYPRTNPDDWLDLLASEAVLLASREGKELPDGFVERQYLADQERQQRGLPGVFSLGAIDGDRQQRQSLLEAISELIDVSDPDCEHIKPAAALAYQRLFTLFKEQKSSAEQADADSSRADQSQTLRDLVEELNSQSDPTASLYDLMQHYFPHLAWTIEIRRASDSFAITGKSPYPDGILKEFSILLVIGSNRGAENVWKYQLAVDFHGNRLYQIEEASLATLKEQLFVLRLKLWREITLFVAA
ncbi:hypothetical protein ACQ4M3_07570 [Leptolyngbya sp. AN03gr2]|uniref:hypothetical protein n=1 Tax=unclassified Leptolyngbya TaxID=2650499 RepID=UPI003D32395F